MGGLSIIFTLIPVVVLGAMAMDIYVPAVPQMPLSLETDVIHIQWTLSIFMIGLGLGQMVFGPIADRIGRRKTIFIGLVLYIIASILCACAQTVNALLFARLLQAFGSCACYVSAFAMVRDQIREELRPKIYSYLNGAIGIAPMLAPLLGGYLLHWSEGDWRINFIFLTLFGVVCLLFLFFRLEETQQPLHRLPLNKKLMTRYLAIGRDRDFRKYSLCLATAMSTVFLYFSMSPIIFIGYLGVSETHYGYLFGANALMITISCFLCPSVQNKIGSDKIILLGASFIVLAGCLMLSWYYFLTFTISALLYPMLLASMGIGFIIGPATAGALNHFGNMAGTASALMGCIRFCIPSIVAAFVMRWDITSTCPLACSLIILGLICAGCCLTKKSDIENIDEIDKHCQSSRSCPVKTSVDN